MEEKFQIVPAAESEAEALAGLIDAVYQQLEHASWFLPDDADYVRMLMNPERGRVWKALETKSGRLAGLLMLLFPGDTEKNLGHDAGLSAEERKSVAHVESVAVLPEFRGYGLQYRMMRLAEAEAKKACFTHLLCTVHPENRYSRENMEKLGFHSVKTAEKYGGFIREVMLKVI